MNREELVAEIAKQTKLTQKSVGIIGQSKWKKSDTKWKILPTL